MIEMEIPKDVMSVETTLVGPLTARQAICFGLTAVVEYVYYTVASTYFKMNIDDLVGLGVIFAIPILSFCLFKPYDMPLEKWISKCLVHSLFSPKMRIYKAENIFAEEEKKTDTKKEKKYSSAELKRHPEYILYQ